MSRDKQIEEMAKIIGDNTEQDTMWGEIYDCANALYNAGYRKIYDDHQRQCTCYALGCQMAEELKRKVAREIFEEIEKLIVRRMIPDVALIDDRLITNIAELKKKYTEEGK